MATVQFIDGRMVSGVRLTDIQHVGDEGARRATAHLYDKTYPVYHSDVDGINEIWYEQQSRPQKDIRASVQLKRIEE